MGFPRSLMYVPGNRLRMIERALGLGEFGPSSLDVAILDLEDGTPPMEKENARSLIAASLARRASASGGPRSWARVNSLATDWTEADLAAVIRPGLEAIVLPKVDEPRDVVAVAALLDAQEPKVGVASGSVRIVPTIESARAIEHASAIAHSSARVLGLLFGAEDYALDLGLPAEREAEAADLLYARSAVVNAATAARIPAFDGIFPTVTDYAGLRADSLRGRRLGFTGKSAIHPEQIAIINEVFSPSTEELAFARAVLAAFDAAVARGEGAVMLDGRMLDRPIVERARRMVAGTAVAR